MTRRKPTRLTGILWCEMGKAV